MINKKIWDYFNDSVEYPHEIVHNPIPYGTVWCYVSSTFLNGFVNYVKPISCFVLDRYKEIHDEIDNDYFTVCNRGEFGKWHKWNGIKKDLINAIISGEKEMYHTDMRCFQDDIILLGEVETEIEDGKSRYVFFWFDMDVSDCCIGKFETTDKKEDIILSIKNWLDKEIEENNTQITNYTELPTTFLKGWVKF